MHNVLLLTATRGVRDYVISQSNQALPAFSPNHDINLVITNGITFSMNAEPYPNLKYITYEGRGGTATISSITSRKITIIGRTSVNNSVRASLHGKVVNGQNMLKDVTCRLMTGGARNGPNIYSDNTRKFRVQTY